MIGKRVQGQRKVRGKPGKLCHTNQSKEALPKARERPPVSSAADRLGQMRTENPATRCGRGVALASGEAATEITLE